MDHHQLAIGYLLTAPDSLLDQLSPLLESHDIYCTQTETTTIIDGRRTIDLVTYECVLDTASVELSVERRRGRAVADITLTPRRRVFFWKHNPSEKLAERVMTLLCENGAEVAWYRPTRFSWRRSTSISRLARLIGFGRILLVQTCSLVQGGVVQRVQSSLGV